MEDAEVPGGAVASLPNDLRSSWDWDYEIDSLRLDELYRKTVAEQWQADTAIDWSQTIDPSQPLVSGDRNTLLGGTLARSLGKVQRERLTAAFAVESFSQILHGEQGALIVSSQLVAASPDRDVKLCAAAQVMDEARHVDIFSRYVKRLGPIPPPSFALRRILDRIVRFPTWQGQMIGMQIVIEGLALTTFKTVRQSTSCELLRSLLDYVIKDEARHMAFGKISLDEQLRALPEQERITLEDFTCDLVIAYRRWGAEPEDMIGLCQVLVEAGIDPAEVLREARRKFEAGEPLDLSEGMRAGLDTTIIPALTRLGLINERVRKRYRAVSIELPDDLEALDMALDELVR
jgi:hypothetical protein